MSFEVEIKFRVADPAALADRLRSMGSEGGPEVPYADLYLAHPGRDFAATDEALRLRRVGQENRMTYKGPKRGGPTKTREEIEIPYEAGPEGMERMSALFQKLGFRPVALVTKTRRAFAMSFGGRALDVVIDRAGVLGDFAEVEALAADEDDLFEAQKAVLDLAATLELTAVEPRSYLRMTLEWNG